MKILLTGGTSFTGMWFARTLAAAGHQVMAPVRGALDGYEGLRAKRLRLLGEAAELVADCPFGSDNFLSVAAAGGFDVLCHHAARVGDYRSPDFDVPGAVSENTHNLPAILRVCSSLKAVVLTGSVFEQDEGIGSPPLKAFSPYGLSKGLTAQVFRYWCDAHGVPLRKFVIANPFGPLEEPRFTAYMARQFLAGKPVEVRTPLYVRDNIHVDLLARAYAAFVGGDAPVLRPSLYAELQGSFARRFAREIGERLNLACVVTEAEQTDFSEPMVRIGRDPVRGAISDWSESKAWDEIAATIENSRIA